MNKSLSIAAQLGRAEVMLAGMAVHAEALARRGIDSNFLTRMNACHARACDAHRRKLAYKARMMEQTAECGEYLDELQDLYSEARCLVKIELPAETWREFGITDQR
jgi:hypothetical protein